MRPDFAERTLVPNPPDPFWIAPVKLIQKPVGANLPLVGDMNMLARKSCHSPKDPIDLAFLRG